MPVVPVAVTRVVAMRISMHGDAGAAWGQRLPSIISESAGRWGLELEDPFPEIRHNVVAPARRHDGTEVVLKVRYPDAECATEIAALRLIDGGGAARLLDADPPSGALLLERLVPGTSVETLDDDAATEVLAAAMLRCRRPVPVEHGFPSVEEWLGGFERLRAAHAGAAGPVPPATLERAESLVAGLLVTASDPELLHGDLHHGNVLAAEREPWLAIDPAGVIGELACEAAPMLRNRLPARADGRERRRILDRRLGVLGEALGIERQRLRDWGVVLNTLSLAWGVEDEGILDEPTLAVVESLAGL